MQHILRLDDVTYFYNDGRKRVHILEQTNYTFERGNLYAILGPSGSGKTTALALAGALDIPKQGLIEYEGQDIKKLGMTRYRKTKRAMVFQSYNLLTYMSALQNVTTAMEISGAKKRDKVRTAMQVLQQVGLSEDEAKRPVLKLSGGQQQRVAIARALACEVDLILADEPTGNLDQKTARDIIRIFQALVHEHNKCVIVVTHSNEVAKAADKVIVLKEGQFVEQ